MNKLEINKLRNELSIFNSKLIGVPYENLLNTLNIAFPEIPIVGRKFSNSQSFFKQKEYQPKNVIFRARPNLNNIDVPYNFVSEISYIPYKESSKIKKWGRVNKPKQSMFYGALNLQTACHEMAAALNCFNEFNEYYLTVGVWEFTTPLLLAEIPQSEYNIDKLYDILKHRFDIIKKPDFSEEHQMILNILDNAVAYEVLQYFSQGFTMFDEENIGEDIYKISNYYADRIFNKIKDYQIDTTFDGIIYPSRTNCYLEQNLVLKPDVVDKNLNFIEAISVALVRSKDDLNGWSAEIFPIKKTKSYKNGELNWGNSFTNDNSTQKWEYYLNNKRRKYR